MHHNVKGQHSVKNIIFSYFFPKINHIYLIFRSFVAEILFLSTPAIYITIGGKSRDRIILTYNNPNESCQI